MTWAGFVLSIRAEGLWLDHGEAGIFLQELTIWYSSASGWFSLQNSTAAITGTADTRGKAPINEN
jgi:hypothetical protein